ncbi:MAG: PAS domain-containing protein [Methanobacterium sp. ERen5]|nr:MAG: PAS domain-containing protein [Methanobacterium sp. ERen5]
MGQLKNSLKEEVETSLEYKILTKNREEKWLKERTNLETNSNGKPVSIRGVLTDITHEKAAQQNSIPFFIFLFNNFYFWLNNFIS